MAGFIAIVILLTEWCSSVLVCVGGAGGGGEGIEGGFVLLEKELLVVF